MSRNKNLASAKENKDDEFYTQLGDIERELRNYKRHLEGKVVYANCDDPRISNFFHYFSYNFEHLGLKKLITTCYRNQKVNQFSQNDSEKAIWLEYNGDINGSGVPDLEEIGIKPLDGDGDFRSQESIELLKQADVVVTNPPFSVFSEYVGQLIEHDKKFLIIGNKNAVTYKEIFPLIMDNKMWVGHTPMGKEWLFDINQDLGQSFVDDGRHRKYTIVDGVIKGRAQACWFTNLNVSRRDEDLILYKKYSPKEYPKYDNYDAINVIKTAEIPMDYPGVMGVPITFLAKHNPDQFEIVGCSYNYGRPSEWHPETKMAPVVNGKNLYKRLFIRNKRL